MTPEEELIAYMETAALMRDAGELILRARNLTWSQYTELGKSVEDRVDGKRHGGYRFVVSKKNVYLYPNSEKKLIGTTSTIHLHEDREE